MTYFFILIILISIKSLSCFLSCTLSIHLVKSQSCMHDMNYGDTDCGSNDPDLKQEMEKQFVDLLTEELKLQEAVSEEHARHMNITFGEAKRVASQYQREAEKCIAATETCEEARERAEVLLIRERKATTLWEQRARQMGWEGE